MMATHSTTDRFAHKAGTFQPSRRRVYPDDRACSLHPSQPECTRGLP